jgi:gluconolactonase
MNMVIRTMQTYDIIDPRFSKLIIGHARLEHLWSGARWSEGPVYVPAARHLIWSDIPNDRLLRFNEDDSAVSIFATSVGYHNGHTLDHEGRVLACEHGGRRISRLDHDGQWRNLCDRIEGKRFNSPNDIVVKSDGSIWFTDPSYGIDSSYEGSQTVSDIGACHVYRFDPATGSVATVATDRIRPNGLAFSPDEALLYVSDTGATHVPGTPAAIHAYPVARDGMSLGASRTFATCEAGLIDGFRCDWHGNVWASSADAVCCYASDGTLIGRVPVPEIVGNVCFGGPKRNRLYIAAQTSLYAIFLNTHAAGWNP